MQWILGNVDKHELIMWLYGSAGAGKSAIAQSIAELCTAELCTAQSILLATFFFSRTDSSRNHASSLFPTLAYQLAMYPEARGVIEAIVEKDPLVFSRSIEVQLELLVIRPLRRIFEATPPKEGFGLRYVIIIDGLDECQDSAVQCSILKAIANTLTQQRGRLPLIFLIASRPEQDITMTISTISNQDHPHRVVTRLALDDSYASSADFYEIHSTRFEEIIP
jgi:NACHT domain